MDLQDAGPTPIQVSETLPPAQPSPNERRPQVLGHHFSANGEADAYAVSVTPTASDPWTDSEIKIVNTATSGASPVIDTNPVPADEPFEVAVTQCQVVGMSVEASLSLRQWAGGSRKLTIQTWVEDEGQRTMASPLPQAIGDGGLAELRITIPMASAPVSPTCVVNAWEGSTAHMQQAQARLP